MSNRLLATFFVGIMVMMLASLYVAYSYVPAFAFFMLAVIVSVYCVCCAFQVYALLFIAPVDKNKL